MKKQESTDYINTHLSFLKELVNLAIKGLEDMYIPETYEFAMKKVKVNGKVKNHGKNLRYTLINLIGLHKAESHNLPLTINLQEAVKYHISKSDKYKGVGELGLLLWATALISPEEIKSILPKVNFNNILENYKDARLGYTMELSWLLTGVLLASTFDKDFKDVIGDLPKTIYNMIRKNYGGVGVFRHEAKISLNGKIRGKIGSFADQVYPIYAFSLYSQQMQNEEASMIVKDCAKKMCEHQGENGEWMWHYNAESGKIICKYPIYSVHQDAMAPFTLFAAQNATGENFEKYIYKGLTWLENKNELDKNMIDWENNAVWRRIAPSNYRRKSKLLLSLTGINIDENKKLKVLYESWSYHLGWILFAFAGRVNNFNKMKSKLNSSNENINIFNLNHIKNSLN